MYAFTAAHKSLPLPSFARVTNLENGRSVVVRVNDRGPFHEGRVIDLSYAAAVKLDIHRRGTGRVEVRALVPGQAQPPQLLAAASPSTMPAAVPAAIPATSSASAMDGLVQALPQPAAPAVAAASPAALQAATAPPPRAADHPDYGRPENRFELVQDGRVRSADEFDAWMKARQARYDAYQRAYGDAAPAAGPGPAAVATPATAPSAPASAPVAPPPSVPAAAVANWLQVGVFSVRDNADGALARLRAAGIVPAAIQGAIAGGRQVWRVRVGPVAPDAVGELSSRVAGLGFGMPHLVRE